VTLWDIEINKIK